MFKAEDKFETKDTFCNIQMGHVFRLTEPEHICQKIPGKDTGAGVDVNGGVGKTVQQELLVDDVLA